MVDIRRTRTCEKCNAIISLDEVKLFPKDATSNWLVCPSCCERLKTRSKDKAQSKLASNIHEERRIEEPQFKNVVLRTKKEPKPEPIPVSTQREMFCRLCNYSFSVDKSKLNPYDLKRLCCPYCGKTNHLTPR